MSKPQNSVPQRRPQIRISVNAYELRWKEESSIYQYHDIDPLWQTKSGQFKYSRALGIEILHRLQVENPASFPIFGVFDGKHLFYSTFDYGKQERTYVVNLERDSSQKQVRVALKFATSFQPNLLETLKKMRTFLPTRSDAIPVYESSDSIISTGLNVLNLFVQSAARKNSSLYKREVVYFEEQVTSGLQGLEIWPGIFQSVRLTMNRILVNVDFTLGLVLPRRPLRDLCEDFLRPLRGLSDRQQNRELRNFLRGIKVEVEVVKGRKRRARPITDLIENVRDHEFVTDEGCTSVGSHFQRVYSISLRPGELGVKLGKGEVFPNRVCLVSQQLYKSKASPEQIAKMMLATPRGPPERFGRIEGLWKYLGHSTTPEITIDTRPLATTGDLMDTPTIGYGRAQTVKLGTTRGAWNITSVELFKPAVISEVIFMNFAKSSTIPVVEQFCVELVETMTRRGISIGNVSSKTGNPQDAIRALRNCLPPERPAKPLLLIIILQERAGDLYHDIKRWGNIEVGCFTDCVKWDRKLENSVRQQRGSDQYYNNFILKVNSKLGGINHRVTSPSMDGLRTLDEKKGKKTMVLGADISHSGKESLLPSIASVVASMDVDHCQYVAKIGVQTRRSETIERMEDMVSELLVTFGRKNGTFPRNIIMWRDGCSEGEFPIVRQKEIAAIIAAVDRVYPKDAKRPAFTFIVVGKRHHYRFFPEGGQGDRTNNCPSGFLLDHAITHPVYDDFYLQSQPGLKGTSIPGHYTVLRKDGSLETIQDLAYSLCHCYARSTRAVKVPAPVYYADLVCRRAEQHWDPAMWQELDERSIENEDNSVPELGFFQSFFNSVHPSMAESMYFV